MSKQISIDVDPLLMLCDDSGEATRVVFALADELNDALPGIECAFVHLDTGNFLVFNGPNVRLELTKPCPVCECTILRNETFCPACLTLQDARSAADKE